MTCAILLDEYRLAEPALLASLLEQHGGLPAPVATKLARPARGIIWENAPPAAARNVAQALSASGHPARVIQQSQVAPTTNPRRVHLLDLEGEMLGIQLRYSGPPERVPWSDVLVLSACVFQTEVKKTEIVEFSDSRGLTIQDERVQIDINRNIVADVITRGPPAAGAPGLLHIRLQCHEVNYAKTLGGTIHEGWREKFAVLVAKLGLRAEQALISPQTESLLLASMAPGNCDVNPYFENEAEFAAYNRWLLTRKLTS